MNTCYKHYYYFVTEFNLVDRKELEPLVSVSKQLHVTGVAILLCTKNMSIGVVILLNSGF